METIIFSILLFLHSLLIIPLVLFHKKRKRSKTIMEPFGSSRKGIGGLIGTIFFGVLSLFFYLPIIDCGLLDGGHPCEFTFLIFLLILLIIDIPFFASILSVFSYYDPDPKYESAEITKLGIMHFIIWATIIFWLTVVIISYVT